MTKNLQTSVRFHNEVINKKKLQQLMQETFHNYGIIKSSLISDKVKNLTFHYATISGISLSIEDLRVPVSKRALIGMTTNEVDLTEQNHTSGNITTVERFQKVIDIWNNANNSLKDEVLMYFRESDPLNPLYIMAFSGARGNISQVRQLVGMRGLMADPQGEIIDLPIKSNFREGLKVTEYIISSYGARKGLVDTALRTADSGYLTRRLVDVAQDIIVREEDCLTTEGLSLDDLFHKYKTETPFYDRLIGRLVSKPLKDTTGEIRWPSNTELGHELVTKILNKELLDVKIRSPLTCNALRSVCRKCYGWHLSYSRLVDLGEAVGILAAQSIGEPGTQLTMRTFHTGGVFSGDLTKQIRAPFAGTIEYALTASATLVRTIHGEKGFSLREEVFIKLENTAKTICTLKIPSNALLVVNTGQKVYQNQVIAEIKKDANLILEEERNDIFTSVSGEVFLQNIDLEESIDTDGAIKKISKTSGLMWVLYGTRYTLQGNSKLCVEVGQKFCPNETIASQSIFNQYAGTIKYNPLIKNDTIRIVNSAVVLENGIVEENLNGEDTLVLQSGKEGKTFKLCVKNNTVLKHGQTIASLKEDLYKTKTGGVLYYSTISNSLKKKRNIKKIFTGSLFWVPEETHQLTELDLEELKNIHGRYISKNTCLTQTISSQTSGVAIIDEINSELIIKPGELYQITEGESNSYEKNNRFVEPGETLFPNFNTQKLSYIESISVNQKDYILLRPVIKYPVPQDKGFLLKHKFFPTNETRGVVFRTIRKMSYKDGERIKSNGKSKAIHLLQTFLVLDIQDIYSNLQPKIEYKAIQENGTVPKFKLRVTLAECINTNENTLKDLKNEYPVFFKYLIRDNQYVTPKTKIAQIEVLSNVGGTIVAVDKRKSNIETLILKDQDIKKCFYDPNIEKLLINKGDLVRVGTFLTNTTRSKYAGQIYRIEKDTIYIRLGRPYLISEGTVLRASEKTLVEKSDMLATLVYDKLKTVDIVQGLPKVEEILEARKVKNGCLLAPHEGKAYKKDTTIEINTPSGKVLKINIEPKTKVNFTSGQEVNFLEPLTDGPISPHDKLEILFNYYQLKNPTHLACKKSFKQLQLFLISEVQRTYFSQGVQIADKHIEIIVKQMTSKVKVYNGGDTSLLPGEILDINQAEIITNNALANNEETPTYRPLLLGLTKASLNSSSFISAASFQETTRVLTEAAIEGKKDWLNGLKENVIIGRLIPAGTGFNSFENLKKNNRDSSTGKLIGLSNKNKLKSLVLKARTS